MTGVIPGGPRPLHDAPDTWTLSSPIMDAMNDDMIQILLVEDSPDDADLTIEALREGRVRNHISVVEDGVEAMAFLRRRASTPRPRGRT